MSEPSSSMNRPVSSTPFPPRTHFQRGGLGDLYDDISISPITQFNNVRKNNALDPPQQKPIVPPKKSVQTVKPTTSNRRKPSELTKESASSAVFKELGIKLKPARMNLSHSRNMYSTQFVVLDSDEEENVKSVIEVKPSSTDDLKLKRNATRDGGKNIKSEIKQSKNKSDQTEADIVKPVKNKNVAVAENLKPPTTRNPRGTKRKQPLNSLENLPQTTKSVKSVNNIVKKVVKQTPEYPKTIILDDSDSFFHISSNSGNKKKRIITNTPLFEDLMNDNTIQWTPRTKKKMKAESVGEDEEVNNDDKINSPVKNKQIISQETSKKVIETKIADEVSDKEVDYNKNKPSSNINIKDASKRGSVLKELCEPGQTKKPSVNRVLRTRKTMPVKEVDQREGSRSYKNDVKKNKTDAVAISRFADILFKPNKNNGGIVAKSLETSSQRFGYLEVEKDKVFSGSSSNVTFVMMEGKKMKVFSQGETHTLHPGDMIHFKTDADYKFQNVGCEFTRLLFIKDKIL